MIIKKKIKVLVVDDSLVFREMLARGIAGDAGIEVVGTASDPFQARDQILAFEPDVMTLDVEMPKMNGIEFLRRLMPQYPIPVIVVSAVSENVFDALNAGAVDFVSKADAGKGMDSLVHELIVKIKIASTAKVSHWKHTGTPKAAVPGYYSHAGNRIIAVGASTGGTEAVFSLLSKFSANIPGILIVQHMPPVFTKMYADRLNHTCPMEVREARDGDLVAPGLALIAPGDYHMRLKKQGSAYYVECFKGQKVNGHCPSVDVLFASVAELAGRNAVGIILTGMGYDGAKGLLEMRKKGARTIGQDASSCIVYGMPKVAYDLGAVEVQTSLENIPHTVFTMLGDRSD